MIDSRSIMSKALDSLHTEDRVKHELQKQQVHAVMYK